jgi:hypothetical protein
MNSAPNFNSKKAVIYLCDTGGVDVRTNQLKQDVVVRDRGSRGFQKICPKK